MEMKNLPDADDCSTFSEQQAIDYISEVVDQLRQCEKSLDMNLVSDLIYRISSSYFDLDDHLDKICDIFINKGLIKSLYYFLWILGNSKDITDQTLNLIYVSLINFTDHSEKFAQAVYSSEILKLLINNCLDDSNLLNIKHKSINELIKFSLQILNNIYRDPGNIISDRLAEFKATLMKLIKMDNNNILSVLSMLTLSYIINDNECHLLDEGLNVVNILFEKINYILDTSNRSSGFTIGELMNGIRCISSNDKMKRRIHDCNGIPIFMEIFKRNVEKEIEPTLGTIWNLCFIYEIKSELVNVFNINEIIQPFIDHESDKIRRNCNGILWEISDKTNRQGDEVQTLAKDCFDVFISYSWSNKSKVLEIYEYLIQYNIRVWLDENQMVGDSLEAMASGIENSCLFIAGMSRPYMKSQNCRSEVEYAHRINKPIIPMVLELKFKPHGWLGIIMGTKVYYEFSERRKSDEVIFGLIKSIKCQLQKSAIPIEEPEIVPTTTRSETFVENRKNSISKNPKLNDDVRNWNSGQVMKWLERSQLSHVSKKFASINGPLLEIMFDIRSNSPEYFNKTLKSEFGIKFVDVLKFHKALNDLTSY